MYLQAARSIAAFAGMCDRGLPEDMYEVAQRDDTTINALTILHHHDYDCKRAIQALVKCPIPKGIDRKWSDDDQKKFIKGLRQYGKNFYRIRKEHLPHRETSELVEFYYLWKKTPQAQSSRPRRRQRPCSTVANLSSTPTPVKQRNAKTNQKDECEQNSDHDDSTTTTDTDEQSCQHCQSLSKDLQSVGRDHRLLCSDCRVYAKKNGEMPTINQESSRYLFRPLHETHPSGAGGGSSTSKRKRNRLRQSPSIHSDENSSSTRNSFSTRSSKKKTRLDEQIMSIKEEEQERESTLETIIKLEEQENEKPTVTSSFLIDARDSQTSISSSTPAMIRTPTAYKQEFNPSSSNLTDTDGKRAKPILLMDHSTDMKSNSMISSSLRIKSEDFDGNESSFHSNPLQSSFSAFSRTSKSISQHSATSDGHGTSTGSKKNHSLARAELSNDDDNTSDDNSSNEKQEPTDDTGPTPLTCEREFYNKSQGVVLLRVLDRSLSDNSCARTDIVLKLGSRRAQKHIEEKPDNTKCDQEQDSSSPSSTRPTKMMNGKQEERHSSKLSFGHEKGSSLGHHLSAPPHPSSLNTHPDPFFFARNNSVFHPLALHALAGGHKLPNGFPSPFSPSSHDNPALRHLDPLALRLMHPSASAAQLFSPSPASSSPSSSSPYNSAGGRSSSSNFDPGSAALLLDPRYRSLMPPLSNGSPSNHGTHNHAHIHSHSHTHLHLPHNNDSPSSPAAPGPPSLMPFPNPLSNLPHPNPFFYAGGPPTPSSLEAAHNLTRERDLMAFMLANNNRFDPMSLALANSLQISRHEDSSRQNARDRSIREFTENEYRRLNFDLERQHHLRFPFPHPSDEFIRRF